MILVLCITGVTQQGAATANLGKRNLTKWGRKPNKTVQLGMSTLGAVAAKFRQFACPKQEDL
jgi:hypothetical protein